MATRLRQCVGLPAARRGAFGLLGKPLLALIAVAFLGTACINQKGELQRERCAQLANLGYRDQARIVSLLRANGLPVAGNGQRLRRSAKEFCSAHG